LTYLGVVELLKPTKAVSLRDLNGYIRVKKAMKTIIPDLNKKPNN
jgi:hypothetical protein